MNSKFNKQILENIFEWDVNNWAPAINCWEKYLPTNKETCETLEIGGGINGGLSLWLAMSGCNVICSGLNNVKDHAIDIHVKYNVQSKILYQKINVLEIPYKNRFDIIAFKSVLGALSNLSAQKVAIEQIFKALKPGGFLFFAENLVATPIHSYLRKMYGAGKNGWTYINYKDTPYLFDKFKFIETKTTGFLSCLVRNEYLRSKFSIIDKHLFDRFIPKAFRYIFWGVVQKEINS